MYKKWTIQDIQAVIDEISQRWNYSCRIKIEISKRATKRMGAFFYCKKGKNIEPIKFVFAENLLDGRYSENVVREVIIHEYLHYYCNMSTNKNNGHNSFFKECCIKSNISSDATFKYTTEKEDLGERKKYKIRCTKCNNIVCIHVRKDAALRKINNYISKCCREKLYCDNLFL